MRSAAPGRRRSRRSAGPHASPYPSRGSSSNSSSSPQGEGWGPGTMPAMSGSSPPLVLVFGRLLASSRRAVFSFCFSCRARSRARLCCVGLDFCTGTSRGLPASRRPQMGARRCGDLGYYQRGSRRRWPPGLPPRSPPPPVGFGRASLTASFRPSSSVSFNC